MAISARGVQHFRAVDFDRLLADHGTPAVWRRRRLCPCLDRITGQPDPNCPHCQVLPGSIWDEGASIVIFAPARRREDLYDPSGHLLQGMVTLTFPSAVTPGHLDWIELSAAEILVNGEWHVRGQLDALGRSTERLRLPHALSLEFVDSIAGEELTSYGIGSDVSLDPSGAIEWITDGPAEGQLYSVTYRARPVYICWAPDSRDENATKQPYRSVAQRLDFFRQPSVGEE